jgi:hypothetical protein
MYLCVCVCVCVCEFCVHSCGHHQRAVLSQGFLLLPFSRHPCLPPAPYSLTLGNHLSVLYLYSFVTLRMTYEWNYTVSSRLRPMLLIQHNCLEIHSSCSIDQWYIHFAWWVYDIWHFIQNAQPLKDIWRPSTLEEQCRMIWVDLILSHSWILVRHLWHKYDRSAVPFRDHPMREYRDLYVLLLCQL